MTAHKKHGPDSPLMLHRTSKTELEQGVTIMVKGEGVRVFDAEGRSYLDLVSAVTRPMHVGYGREELAKAAYDQMLKLPYFTPMSYSSGPAMDLASALAEIAPDPITRFLFVCDGSEAVEAAMKIARHCHEARGDKKRYKIISRRGAYHGVTGGALRALGTILPMRQIMEPLAPGTAFIDSPYCYRCPYALAYPSCDMHCAAELARIIEFEDPEQVSAFIAEPIQQGFGALSPPLEYWPMVREICDRYGVLAIVDEVICGFGRTGKWFGIDHFDFKPDLITMAKGISSGYIPLGGVGAAEHVHAPIEMLHHLHTYGNHPVSCAVGLKNIEIIKQEKLVENSQEMGQYFLTGLKSLEAHKFVGEARGAGLWAALDLTLDKKTKAPFPVERLAGLVGRAKEKGLIIKMMGQALEFAPALIITRAEIDEAVNLIDQCLFDDEKEFG